MTATAPANKRIGWGVINLLVILYALIPVLWIVSLSFKTADTITDVGSPAVCAG